MSPSKQLQTNHHFVGEGTGWIARFRDAQRWVVMLIRVLSGLTLRTCARGRLANGFKQRRTARGENRLQVVLVRGQHQRGETVSQSETRNILIWGHMRFMNGKI